MEIGPYSRETGGIAGYSSPLYKLPEIDSTSPLLSTIFVLWSGVSYQNGRSLQIPHGDTRRRSIHQILTLSGYHELYKEGVIHRPAIGLPLSITASTAPFIV